MQYKESLLNATGCWLTLVGITTMENNNGNTSTLLRTMCGSDWMCQSRTHFDLNMFLSPVHMVATGTDYSGNESKWHRQQ